MHNGVKYHAKLIVWILELMANEKRLKEHLLSGVGPPSLRELCSMLFDDAEVSDFIEASSDYGLPELQSLLRQLSILIDEVVYQCDDLAIILNDARWKDICELARKSMPLVQQLI